MQREPEKFKECYRVYQETLYRVNTYYLHEFKVPMR